MKNKNVPMPLPIAILTGSGTTQIILTDKWTTIKSSFPPVADPKGYYLKLFTAINKRCVFALHLLSYTKKLKH